MTFKKIATASAALLMLTGAAFAQTSGGAAGGGSSGGGSGTQISPFASDNEKAMYESNKEAMGGFFTDDTMSTLRSDDEMKAAWTKMDQGQQAGLRAACQTAMDAKEGYGPSTSSICTNVLGR